MDLVSVAVALLLAGMLGLLVVGLPAAILRNMSKGNARREALAEDVGELRLGRMLDGLGTERDQYLHLERVVDIEQQIKRCRDCDETEQCDDLLAKDQPVQPDTAGFCPNMDGLQRGPRD